MKAIAFFILFLSSCPKLSAQLALCGKIEYEKKINTWARVKDLDDDDENHEWYERTRANTPQYNITYFDLSFNTSRSMYKPGRDPDDPNKSFTWAPATDNIVRTDFQARTVQAIKNVFEERFLVTDTNRVLEWKDKDEFRTIMGHKCRKAVSRICDSVYVIAFYCEDFTPPGGPEMFGGLPGMILELAIPRLHTTWTADKIETTPPDPDIFTMSTKGKKVSEHELFDAIQKSMKDWGKWGTQYVWWTVL